MSRIEQCAFCDQDALKSQLVYEDKLWLIIFARRPLAQGHVMVIPKMHFMDLKDLEAEELATIGIIIEKASTALSRAFQAGGINIFTNMGKSAGQSIPHFHVHIITRFDNELISPFQILNSPEDYKKLPRLDEKELLKKVEISRNSLIHNNLLS